jgi:hypothetical protein
MSHIAFIDSSYVGLRAITTARRLGHEVTLVIPAEATMFFVMGLSDEHIAKHLGPRDRLIYAEKGSLDAELRRVN